MNVQYIDRVTKEVKEEQIPCKICLQLLYSHNPLAWIFRPLLCKWPWVSAFFGKLQNCPSSKKNIQPFIDKYKVDTSDFLEPIDSYATFNEFFTRKLKASARKIESGNDIAILPADARYLAYQDISGVDGFLVKGKKFSLETLLKDSNLAEKYAQGSMAIARLAPVDYHRFHFPVHCTPSKPKLINGPLYSVNPIALKYNIDILSENKRMITHLNTAQFGIVLYIEIGATNVGSINQTSEADKQYAKGDEKGYFAFGGSCIILLFESGKIQLDHDLLENTQNGLETLGRIGQTLGRLLPSN